MRILSVNFSTYTYLNVESFENEKIQAELINPPQEICGEKESRKRSFRFPLTENHDRVWFNDNSGLVFLKSEISRRNRCSRIGSRYFPFSPAKGKFGFQMRRTRSDFLGTFVSIDKSAPSGADGCEDIRHGANPSDSIKNTP